ncbi:MAG: lamin tail domain-containing protein, partial [Rhodothermaceae bacterium]|nr:lamin tail domain-containing protein [Rhodothermaceae bacterium]
TAPFTALPNTRYRFEATRSDGAVSSVEVTTPPIANPSVGSPIASATDVIYPIFFPQAPQLNTPSITLTITGVPSMPQDTVDVSFAYPGRAEMSGTGWTVPVEFVSAVRPFLVEEGLLGVTLVEITLNGFVTNPEWVVPVGGFDPDIIVEPGTISNIENGFGFFGAGYVVGASWVPSVNTQVRAGFASSSEAARAVRINEASPSQGWVEFYNTGMEPVDISGYGLSDNASTPLQLIEGGTVVPGEGFVVIDLAFPIAPGGAVVFLNPGGAVLNQLDLIVSDPTQVVGLYPDGVSLTVQGSNPFLGANEPTRGAPNRPIIQPFLLNEVYTAGDGFVEVIVPSELPQGVQLRSLFVATDFSEVPGTLIDAWPPGGPGLPPPPPPPPPGTILVRDESTLQFDIPQAGGEIFVYAVFEVLKVTNGPVGRVVDYRKIGIQDPSFSEGRLPDGGNWTTGLAPSRGEANSQ